MKRLLSFLVWLLALAFLPIVSVRATSPQILRPPSKRRPLLGWLESQALWCCALVLMLSGMTLAQTAAPLPAALTPYADSITLAIAFLSALLVHPLTAIFKKLGRTQGPTTVLISAVLSLVISGIFTLWQAADTHTGAGLVSALLSAALAFVATNGVYIAQVTAAAKGASLALPTVVTVAGPQVLHPAGTPGTEPLHSADGRIIGGVKPLTPGQPTQVKTGLEDLK